MSNVLDYLSWRGDLSFESDPFNKIDALILAQLSYINLEGLTVNELSNAQTMFEICEKFVNHPEFEKRKKIGAMINSLSAELFIQTCQSNRFKNVRLYKYESIYDEEKMEQFSAATYIIGKTAYVVFRGTDDTLIGWREDFNIVCIEKIPSRIDAARYLSEVSKDFKGSLAIIGHSKGGYLAMDSAATADKKIKKRISAIYNFDGPGFSEEYIASQEFKEIEPVLQSFYPGGSIVGMIFHHNDNYQIVKCNGFGADQHDPFAWNILGKEFVQLDKFGDESKFFEKSCNEWVERLDQKQREYLVSSLFGIINASGCKTNTEIEENKLHASRKMLQAYTNLDKETKYEIHIITRVLAECVKTSIPFLNILNVRFDDLRQDVMSVLDPKNIIANKFGKGNE